MSYRVKTVCTMTGISRNTLLTWERRYEILDPRRSPTGHRIYSDDDVAVLRRLKRLVDDGLAISEAVRMASRERTQRPLPPERDLAEEVLDALSAYERERADRLFYRIRQLTFGQAVDELYLPILRETGARWADGRLSVAQEHFISGWCREQMLTMFHGLGSGPENGPGAVCALGPHEGHELGLLAVAIHLMLAGWRVTWLGADLPIEELCAYVATQTPRLVCLSVSVSAGPELVATWANQLRAAAPPHTFVALGGIAAESVQVDGVAVCDDAEELLAAVRASGHHGTAA